MKIANGPQDLPTPAEMAAMSGMEFVEGIRSGAVPAAPIAVTLGFEMTEVGEGRVVFRGKPGFNAYNPAGTVHGGWFGTILDSCMACAVQTMVPKGSVYTTLEYKVNITRAIPVGMEVVAVGTIQHAGRSTGVANGEIRGAKDGKLYATGSTTCIIMKVG